MSRPADGSMASGAVVLVLLALGARVFPAQQSGPGSAPPKAYQPDPQVEAEASQSTACKEQHEPPPEDESLATRLYSLAELYRAQARYADAEPLYQRSRSLFEEQLGPDHPSLAACLNNLGELYRAQGRYAEAEPLYRRALAIQ